MNASFIRSTLAPCAVLGCLAALLAGCGEPVPLPEPALRPVKSIVVSGGDAFGRDRVFSGSARSAEEVALSFKVSGTVEEIPVALGDSLKRGDLIATLEKDLFEIELSQALAEQKRTEAARRNAESEYQRVRLLYANDNASRNELDTALANAESAKAAHDSAVQGVALARLNLGYTRLTAAKDCAVAGLQVEVNENIGAGQTVSRVNCGGDWEVVIAVPESLISSFEDDLAGVVRFPSVPEGSFRGVVTEVGIGTGADRTFPVTLSLDTVPPEIRSNLAAEVTFQFSNRSGGQNRLYLPLAAVEKDERGRFVFVMQEADEPGAAVLIRRAVEVGEVSELGLEVLSGVEVGERVITAGLIHARDGMLVRRHQD